MEPSELAAALELPDASVRQRAAIVAGSQPRLGYVSVLVSRCEVEPDFFVRDMLTWALIHQDRATVIEALATELNSPFPQARAQALHTISKLNDPDLWPLVTLAHLLDEDDEAARTAWRAAARMVAPGHEAQLAQTLATQFGRGNRSVQTSLSKALVHLAPHSLPVIEQGEASTDEAVRLHAMATRRLLHAPEEGYDVALEYAQRVLALKGAPTPPDNPAAGDDLPSCG